MMERTANNNTFFIEIIIVILFFSICTVSIMNFFVISYRENQNSSDINKAVILVQNTAEEFKSNPNVFMENKLYSNFYEEQGNLNFDFWYDEDFNIINENHSVHIPIPVYIMKIKISDDISYENIKIADISVERTNDNLNLFTLKTGKFVKSER